MNILVAILALSFLIIIHELGHFTAAKLTGIKVLEFSLFMGPKLWSRKKGETEYAVRLIPIGGFVRMEGEEESSEDSRAYNRKPVRVRAAVIAAGPVTNILAAIIIVFVLNITSGYQTNVISAVEPFSPAADAGLQKGDTILKYNGKAILHPYDVFLFLFDSKGKPADIVYKRDGKTEKQHISPEIIAKDRFILGYTPKASGGEGWNEVANLEPNAPAASEGLKIGDRILRLNGKTVKSARDIREFLKLNKGTPVEVTVERKGSGEIPPLKITPMQTKGEEQYDIGVGFAGGKGSFFAAAGNAFNYMLSLSRGVYYNLAWLIRGRVSLNQLSGPVGIVATIGTVVTQSPTFMDKFLNLLFFMAFISVNLGIFNLIPFPALDGSKLIILGVEAVRKKTLPPEKEAFISFIGFILLIMLMIFSTYNDIIRYVLQI